MKLIDRYILSRFMTNFVVLFVLLFVFAAAIDLILNLDEFVKVARARTGSGSGSSSGTSWIRMTLELVSLTINFHGPRLFQFYSYLHGMIAIGAMGFTLAQMYRCKELVAIMASGVSLHRVAMPFVAGVFGLSLLQLINQELTLPRVAPLILRGHTEIGQRGIEEFDVPLTRDGAGSLIHAANFDPQRGIMERPTILCRDEQGLTTLRITAVSAEWDEGEGGWRLVDGRSMRPDVSEGGQASLHTEQVEIYRTDLDPRALIVRRHGEYAAMLSMRQLSEMAESEGVVDTSTLTRYRYSRFAVVLLNIFVMLITLPSYLIREPASLIRQSIICAAISMPAMLIALVMLTVPLPGFSAAMGVFLPVIFMVPIVLGRLMFVKT